MVKKFYNIVFVAIFICMISLPLVFTNWISGGVSEDENRTLAELPEVLVDGQFNEKFTAEYETWFMEHMGFREMLINTNASIQFNVFSRLLDKSNYHIGADGDINYADENMILDYAHLNLRSDEAVAQIGKSYQTVSDWLGEKGIQFYYVQCWDKHSIYPEQFMNSVNQIGDVSKTDQVIEYLRNNTDVNTISLKEVLIESKDEYEVYSNWGDPTHWTDRGAYIGYKYIMHELNKQNDNKFRTLDESDYDIKISDLGITLNGFIHKTDMLETFTIATPQAKKSENSVMGDYGEDIRHSVWINESVDNDTKLLLMCDSYINSFIIRDFAESFSEVWLIWGDYTSKLDDVIEMYDPDIVVYECAERVDRSNAVVGLADKLR